MKKILVKVYILSSCLMTSIGLYAQEKPKVAVLRIESSGFSYNDDNAENNQSTNEVTSLTRIELEKLGLFEVVDYHDLKIIESEDGTKIDDCFTNDCLIKAGKRIQADKMIAGSLQKFYSGNKSKVIVKFKLIDVKTGSIEKSELKEFIDYKDLQKIINITLHALANIPQQISNTEIEALVEEHSFEGTANNPGVDILKLSGPRVGFTVFTGETASILKNKMNKGGFEALPIMFQFGYQFERQYLNSGNFQALFEFIPMITGLDQNIFIPSIAILNGFRNNKSGVELAFGPSIYFVKKAEGYYMNDEWRLLQPGESREGKEMMKRVDSRGEHELSSSFVIAVGKSFRSGNLNIPMNVYVVPSSKSPRFGFSMGFNIKKGGKATHYKYN